MNAKKYMRLCMVLFLPFLVLGIVTANSLREYFGVKFKYIYCFESDDRCDSIGMSKVDHYRQYFKSKSDIWFDVDGIAEHAPILSHAQASRRVLPAEDVQIVSVSGSRGEYPPYLSHLVGRNSTIILGMSEGDTSNVASDYTVLACNSLEFIDQGREVVSRCFTDEGGVAVTYRVTGDSLANLNKLSVSAGEQINRALIEYRMYQVVMYPMFFYLFLLVSFIAWLSIKAVRFVKAA